MQILLLQYAKVSKYVNLTFAVFFVRTDRAVYANLRGARANRAENKIYCKSRVYMKYHKTEI